VALSEGTRLGPYEILEPLGAGGMGEVYRARDPRLKREVALKLLPPELASEPERLARFEREAQTLAALNHPQTKELGSLGPRTERRHLTVSPDGRWILYAEADVKSDIMPVESFR
jgi:serine/threonine protein kinase